MMPCIETLWPPPGWSGWRGAGKESQALRPGSKCFPSRWQRGGKTKPVARRRGYLRVIDGETLLQKLSDWSRANLNFATIAAHRTDVPLRHAWRHSYQQPGWQNSGGAIRGL